MDQNAPFTHEQLDRSLSQIRLISVRPEADGPIRCTIKTINLDADRTPDYRALSYTWGAQGQEHQIYINNQPLSVRQNLYDFLVAFRKRLYVFRGDGLYEDELQWLWVDQICIDQAVVQERNHQVGLMSRIYKQATYVYMWLGPSDVRTEAAMKALKTGFRRYHDDKYAMSVKRKRNSDTMQRSSASSNVPADFADALRHFFRNPYWTRLWIVQEVMLASYIRIICGETLLSWEELKRFCMSDLSSLPAALSVGIPTQATWLAEHALSAKTYDFQELLLAFTQSQCENARDKIYGLQGLLAQAHKIPIDYAKTVEEVYRDAAFVLCATAQGNSSLKSANVFKRVDFCGPLQSICGKIHDSLSCLADDVRSTQKALLETLSGGHCQMTVLQNRHPLLEANDSGDRSSPGYYGFEVLSFNYVERIHPSHVIDRSTLCLCLEKVLEERQLPEQWSDRSMFLLAKQMSNIAQTRTKHLNSTCWEMDLFLPNGYRFRNPSWSDVMSIRDDHEATFECSLVRDESMDLGEQDDVALEVFFASREWNKILVELQTVLIKTAPGQISLVLSVRTDLRTDKMFESKTRYLRIGFDLNASRGVKDCVHATCVNLSRPSFWRRSNGPRPPEQVLNDHLQDPTFSKLGRSRQRTVYTRSTKAKTLVASVEQDPESDSGTPEALDDHLQEDESGTIRDRDEVVFRCVVAAGYSQSVERSYGKTT